MATKQKTCKCGVDFTFNTKRYSELNLPEPNKCARCRSLVKKDFVFENKADLQESTLLVKDYEEISPYLIQSGVFSDDELDKSLPTHGRIKYTYMGSAEYEFGVLPRSYKRIMDNIDKYELHNTYLKNINGVYLYVICKEGSYPAVKAALVKLALDKVRLKEYITFSRHFVKEKEYIRDNFWLDIEHDFAFMFGEEHALQIFAGLRGISDDLEYKVAILPYAKLKAKVQYFDNKEKVQESKEEAQIRKELGSRNRKG